MTKHQKTEKHSVMLANIAKLPSRCRAECFFLLHLLSIVSTLKLIHISLHELGRKRKRVTHSPSAHPPFTDDNPGQEESRACEDERTCATEKPEARELLSETQ